VTASETMSATEFKAKCLEVLDRVRSGAVGRVTITKRGAAVAVLVPPEPQAAQVERLHGCMRGSVIVPDDVDLTAPVDDAVWGAERGEVHG